MPSTSLLLTLTSPHGQIFWSSGSDDATDKVWRSAGVGFSWALAGMPCSTIFFTCELEGGNFPGFVDRVDPWARGAMSVCS
ncbi:hypothetical protein DL95DRAFT_382953, partial [Leptodontidium sp. 2 PMI_412]